MSCHAAARVAGLVFTLTCLTAVATTPPRPGHVFIDLAVGPRGQLVASHSDGVFRSVDGGRSWRQMLPGAGAAIVTHAGASGLYANQTSLYRSIDWGATWRRAGDPHRVDAVDAQGTLYGCGNSNVELSRDNGKTWAPSTSRPGVPEGSVWECQNVFSTNGVVYAWSGAMLARSRDRGATWSLIDTSGNNHENFHVDSQGGLYLNRASSDGARHVGRIYRSRDEGTTWQPLAFGESSGTLGFRLLRVRGTTLFVEIERFDPRGGTMPSTFDIRASANGGRLRRLGVKPHLTVVDARIVPRGDVIYVVDMYRITRGTANKDDWAVLGRKGIPDSYTGMPATE